MNIGQALNLRGESDSYERQEAMWLLEHILELNSLELKMRQMQILTQEQEQQYLDGLMRLSKGEPLAYITGSQPFWSLDLNVTPDTLVPRPDTEILIETVLSLDLPEHCSMVDLGTGTGAIALSLAKERPYWKILATDIYVPTLEVAQSNAKKHALNQVKFLCSAWFEAIPSQKFDLVVSNPPYIDANDEHMLNLGTEPRRALVADKQGLADLERIIGQAALWLNTHGWIAVEHGYDQGQAVRQLLMDHNFAKVQTCKDYGGNDRISLGQWLADT
ncbi:release factor glutamine methyltransferase [Acinetobacter baylyi]|uniref:Release factor glutamine methyltransferase n=1 Tax=Acinetobacter baylyi TaxID=202950 RepID=A0ABU0V0P4_ACIBI|nr:peptide chain release factor N(5)-glutamine methyltransferase [Acinetobacter baylyi]MDQ1210375.1 release factor glutamine methyltransferase [Acinetobacter baylyi]MDR6106029.1 release factor glutamine methyltransferase [Acinetobacter baylyi]MDR6187247.1 release factor glutamine methyltransferase [Acinetobacter baylyi]